MKTVTTDKPVAERNPFDYYVKLGDMGMIRTKRDGIITDLQGYHERAKYLKRRIADLRGPLLAWSRGANNDATEHERELKKVERKTAKLWKELDALDATPAA